MELGVGGTRRPSNAIWSLMQAERACQSLAHLSMSLNGQVGFSQLMNEFWVLSGLR